MCLCFSQVIKYQQRNWNWNSKTINKFLNCIWMKNADEKVMRSNIGMAMAVNRMGKGEVFRLWRFSRLPAVLWLHIQYPLSTYKHTHTAANRNGIHIFWDGHLRKFSPISHAYSVIRFYLRRCRMGMTLTRGDTFDSSHVSQ